MHRDIKLENIILKDKNSNELKIVDFGLATEINNNTELDYLFLKCGTPGFVAPEIISIDENQPYFF